MIELLSTCAPKNAGASALTKALLWSASCLCMCECVRMPTLVQHSKKKKKKRCRRAWKIHRLAFTHSRRWEHGLGLFLKTWNPSCRDYNYGNGSDVCFEWWFFFIFLSFFFLTFVISSRRQKMPRRDEKKEERREIETEPLNQESVWQH